MSEERNEYADWEGLQRDVCRKYGVNFTPAAPDSTLGFAIARQGRKPVYGIRSLPHLGTNGWYIWCGGDKTQDPDFFQPLHTQHLLDRCPEALAFLGLPPGWGFIMNDETGYLDVWFDEAYLAR